MRKKNRYRFRIIFLLFALNFVWLPFGYAQKTQHALMIWGEAGYSAFLTKWDSFKTVGHAGGGIGFGYHALIKNHFIVSIGVEYLSLNSSMRAENIIFYREGLTDTEGDEYTMKYTFHKLSQSDFTHNIFVPFYMGFKTDLGKKADFYMLAGGKFGYMFFVDNYSNKIDYTTVGIYDRFIDPFENMPDHFFDTQSRHDTKLLNFNKIQAVVSLEMGTEISLKKNQRSMRIGVFADYGLLNRQTSSMQQQYVSLFHFNKQIPNDVLMRNLYETDMKKSARTSSLFVGVKVTLLLNAYKLSPLQKCIVHNVAIPAKKKEYLRRSNKID